MKGKVIASVFIGLILLANVYVAIQIMRLPASVTVIEPSTKPVVSLPESPLVFEPLAMQIQRDVDQRSQVILRNDGDTPMMVRATCLPPDDLCCGFLGQGSDGWAEPTTVTLAAGQTHAFMFVVHANLALQRNAAVPVLAQIKDSSGQWVEAARGQVAIQIDPAPLKLKLQWLPPQTPLAKAQMSKVLRITNGGANIPDFTVSFSDNRDKQGLAIMHEGALNGLVNMMPIVQQTMFEAGQTMNIRVWPKLDSHFIELAGKLYLHGHGQYVQVLYDVKLPDNEHVFTVHAPAMSQTILNTGTRNISQNDVSFTLPPVDAPVGLVEDESDSDDETMQSPGIVQAAVLLEFKPKYGKSYCRPMDTHIYFNDKLLSTLMQSVPDGRYVFMVPVTELHQQLPGHAVAQPNIIRIKTQGGSQGNLYLCRNVQLYIKQNPGMSFLAATSSASTQQIAQPATMSDRYQKPDVMVTNNAWELPRGIKPGDTLDAQISLFNAGDLPAQAGRLIAIIGDHVIGHADYQAIASFAEESLAISITLPDDLPLDQPLELMVKADVLGDANPADNQITWTLFADELPKLLFPTLMPETSKKPNGN